MHLTLSEAYVDECQRVWAQHRSTPWRMGDLVNEGLIEYTDGPQTKALFLEQLAAQLECSPKTLSNYARVAGEFLPDTRFEALELGHHEAVLKLDVAGRIEMLTRAAEEMWTVARLRREAADVQPPEPDSLTIDETLVWFDSRTNGREWGVQIEKRKVTFIFDDDDQLVLTSNSQLRWRKESTHEN